jgi:Outer membrane protein beta-barrel domain
MHHKLLVAPILTVAALFAALPASSQTIAPYQGSVIPLAIGGGPSAYNPDWGHGIMYGGTIWVDWYPKNMPHLLQNFALEAEARDISLDRHSEAGQVAYSGQANTKEDTVGGGVLYNWPMFRNIHPYFKGIFSQGSVDFISSSPTYSHDTRFVYAGGGGLEYRVYRPVWVRAEYEYQVWTGKLLFNYLTPEGLTVGVTYDFAHANP